MEFGMVIFSIIIKYNYNLFIAYLDFNNLGPNIIMAPVLRFSLELKRSPPKKYNWNEIVTFLYENSASNKILLVHGKYDNVIPL